ncbi:MAG: hypothetical protein CMJ54_06545 [Planctomycetaceae bacterium]|nr:hypothetical protein [Planctomycetaceae bacterium]
MPTASTNPNRHTTNRWRSRRPGLHRRGVSTILFIVALPALLMFIWLGVEFALILRAGNQAKIAADAIALAAAARLPDGYAAVSGDAIAAASANRAPNGTVSIPIAPDNDAASDLLFGYWDGTAAQFVPDLENGTAVQATVRFAADNANGAPGIMLSGLFELGFIDLQRTSVAVYNPPSQATTLLTRRLFASDDAIIDAFGGVSVTRTSPNGTAVSVTGNARIETSILRVAGAGIAPGSESGIGGELFTNATVPGDPYENTTRPSVPASGESDPGSGSGTTNVTPGWYPNGLTFTSGTYDLSDGIFHLGGIGLDVSGNAAVVGSGALIHLVDSGSEITVSGSGSITGTSYQTPGDWFGVSIIGSASANAWTLDSNSFLDVEGLVIAPNSSISLSGSSRFDATGCAARVYSVSGSSTSTFTDAFIVAPNPTAGRARLAD